MRVDRMPGYEVDIRTPESHDAPIDDRDDRFWRWVAGAVVLAGLIVLVLVLR